MCSVYRTCPWNFKCLNKIGRVELVPKFATITLWHRTRRGSDILLTAVKTLFCSARERHALERFFCCVRPKHFPRALLSEGKRPQKPLQPLFSWKVFNRNAAARNKKLLGSMTFARWAKVRFDSCEQNVWTPPGAMPESNCWECWDKFDSANFVQTFEMSWTSAIWA